MTVLARDDPAPFEFQVKLSGALLLQMERAFDVLGDSLTLSCLDRSRSPERDGCTA
jgi:hypothetical protein